MDEEQPTCPACGGELVWLGALNNKDWFRCRNCGLDQAPKLELHDDDPRLED